MIAVNMGDAVHVSAIKTVCCKLLAVRCTYSPSMMR
jgi:hypothetical protein